MYPIIRTTWPDDEGAPSLNAPALLADKYKGMPVVEGVV
jgi:hypothetical protein